MSDWRVTLNGVTLVGCDDCVDSLGTLSYPPDGLGLPSLRTEDTAYAQRDGVSHGSDWYDARIITLSDVTVCPDCGGCADARAAVRDILTAWGRQCDDVELVIWPPCESTGLDPTVYGPFGVIGRPRVAEVTWERGNSGCATLLLRFDAVDHRMYVLGPDGEPGSGAQCATLTPTVTTFCRSYPRCYPMCYTEQSGSDGGPVDVDVNSTIAISPTITLTGPLTDPIVENTTTGDWVGYAGPIPAGETIVIDTEVGTATQSGGSRTHLLTGNPLLSLPPGENTLRLSAFGSSDSGTAEVCFRNVVVTA